MVAATAAALVGLLATWTTPAAAELEDDFPQAKINFVDVSGAPRIRAFVSLLDKRLSAVPAEWVTELTFFHKERRESPRELFTLADGEATFPEPEDGSEPRERSDEELPLVTLAEEDEGGIAAVVMVPGIDPGYRDTELGERVRNGAGLFFKKLGKANLMNVIWYTDALLTYVVDKGRTAELTPLSATIRAKCADWELTQLETRGEEAEGGGEEGLASDEAYCGLTAEYGELPGVLQTTAFQGAYPLLFGLDVTYCRKDGNNEVPRMSLGRFEGRDDEDEGEDGGATLSAMDLALELLIRGAKPGQPKVIVLLGDGRDDYVHRLDECKEGFRNTNCAGKSGKEKSHCVDELVKKAIAEEQQQFLRKARRWIALAKAAGIRIFTVVHPNARPHERERLEVLAWRTGGTARIAQDTNEVVDHYTELADELNGQLVVTFTDDDAVPGATRSYLAELKGSGRAFKTPPFGVAIPRQPEGMATSIADFRSMGEGKIGKTGFLIAVIAIALILALILLKIFGKLFKKILGKGAKGAKGAAKGAKGAKKLGAGAKKLGKLKK